MQKMKISLEVRQENIYLPCSSSSYSENTDLTNYSTNELQMLHVNRFPSDLVHRHILNTSTVGSPTAISRDFYLQRDVIVL